MVLESSLSSYPWTQSQMQLGNIRQTTLTVAHFLLVHMLPRNAPVYSVVVTATVQREEKYLVFLYRSPFVTSSVMST